MAATNAEAAFGVVLKKGGAAIGDAYTDFGLELDDVTAPGFTREALDATHHQSPNGWGEIILSAIKRQKPFSASFNWVAANTGAIKTAFEGDLAYWKIEFPDGSSVITKLGITDFSPGESMTPDGKMTGSAEFTPGGEPTWA
jgi:hypothetical protein